MRAPLLFAVLLFVPFGCGEDEQQFASDDPRGVVAQYVEALNDEDVATVCEMIAADYELSVERCETGFARAFEKGEIPESDPEEDIGDVSFRDEGTARVENLATGGYWEVVRKDGEWRLQLSD